MNTEEKSLKQFRVAKLWLDQYLSNLRTYVTIDSYSIQDISKKIKGKGLDDARCLLRMMVKECEAYDTRIKTQQTLLNKLKYSKDWLKSKVFAGNSIPFKQIDQLIEKYHDHGGYQIYRHVMGHMNLETTAPDND